MIRRMIRLRRRVAGVGPGISLRPAEGPLGSAHEAQIRRGEPADVRQHQGQIGGADAEPQVASFVAAYSSTLVEGIQRPRPVSSAPPSLSDGIEAVDVAAIDRPAHHDVMAAPTRDRRRRRSYCRCG